MKTTIDSLKREAYNLTKNEQKDSVESEYQSTLNYASSRMEQYKGAYKLLEPLNRDHTILNTFVKMQDLPDLLKEISDKNAAGDYPGVIHPQRPAIASGGGDRVLLVSVTSTEKQDDDMQSRLGDENSRSQGGSILCIKKVKMGDEYFSDVVASMKDADLYEIVVRSCSLSAVGISNAFAQLETMSNLSKVDISGNILGNDGIIQVLRALSAHPIISLRLLGTGISGKNANDLAYSFCSLPLLEKLNISKNDFSDTEGVIEIIDKLQGSRIKELKMAHTALSDRALIDISNKLYLYTGLELLDIRGNTEVDAEKADKCLIAHFVRLSYNGKSISPIKIIGAPLGLDEILKLSDGLRNSDGTITQLVTDFNCISAKLYNKEHEISPVIFEYLNKVRKDLVKKSLQELFVDKKQNSDDIAITINYSVNLDYENSDIVEQQSDNLALDVYMGPDNNLAMEEYGLFEKSVSSIVSQNERYCPLISQIARCGTFGFTSEHQEVFNYLYQNSDHNYRYYENHVLPSACWEEKLIGEIIAENECNLGLVNCPLDVPE